MGSRRFLRAVMAGWPTPGSAIAQCASLLPAVARQLLTAALTAARQAAAYAARPPVVCALLAAALHAPGHAKSIHRIITLAPSATELVYAAGAGSDIIGTVLSSDYPPAARDIPRIGDGIQFSEEKILALHPTLVVGWRTTDATRALARRLEPLGVPILYAHPASLDDIPSLVRQLGARLDTAHIAEVAADSLQHRIAALRPVPPPAPTVFIEISADPLYTLGDDPLVNDLLTRCGGVNPYADRRIAAPQVSVESVLHLNPQVVIVSPYGHETLEARRRYWKDLGLPAAVQGHVYAVDPDWLHRPGPRLVDAAETICRDLGRLDQE